MGIACAGVNKYGLKIMNLRFTQGKNCYTLVRKMLIRYEIVANLLECPRKIVIRRRRKPAIRRRRLGMNLRISNSIKED